MSSPCRLFAMFTFTLLALLTAPAFAQAVQLTDVPGQLKIDEATVYDGQLFFSVRSGGHRPAGDQSVTSGAGGQEVLWSYDAASESLRQTQLQNATNTDIEGKPVVYDGRLFFQADSREHGRELWVYDAATGQATLAADIATGLNTHSSPSDFAVYDARLFFSATKLCHPCGGGELWVYDAATDQATLAADINPDGNAYPSGLTVYGDRLFFSAEDGQHGRELWEFDAATGQATLVADIWPGALGSNYRDSEPEDLTVYNGRLFFSAQSDSGRELWAYDAATDQTMLVADLWPGETTSGSPFSSEPEDLIVYNGRLFFSADTEEGRKLWAYDAATDTAEIIPTPSLRPYNLVVYAGQLHFSLDTGFLQPRKLYAYDASPDFVSVVAEEVWPCNSYNVYASRLYFCNEPNNTNEQLWRYDAADAIPVAITGGVQSSNVVVPGEEVSIAYSITNNTQTSQTGDVWFAVLGTGATGRLASGTVEARGIVTGSYTQVVPKTAATGGYYTYELRIGRFPDTVVHATSFRIFVQEGTAANGLSTGLEAWTVSNAEPWTGEPQHESPEASSKARPEAFALHAAYPNPFVRSAQIGFDVPEATTVRLTVYDVLGRTVAVLVDDEVEAGRHTASLDGAGLAGGTYLVRLTTTDSGNTATQRVTLLR